MDQNTSAPPPPPERPWLLSPWPAVILGAACYLFSLMGGFVRDDPAIVENNPRVRNLTDFRAIWMTDWWATYIEPGSDRPNELRDRLYRPLSLFTFALQYAVHGLSPPAFHAVNIFLHACMCYLVWLLARRLVEGDSVASAAAVLFAVHPVHAEAVCELVGRAEMLASLFLALGLLLVIRKDALPGYGRTIAAAGMFFLALLAKETAICFWPLVFLLWLHFRLYDDTQGFRRRAVPRLALLLLPVTGYFLLRYAALEGQLIRPRLTSVLLNPLNGTNFAEHVTGVLTILGHYTRLMLVPWKLSSDYSLAVVDPRAGIERLTIVGGVVAAGMLVLASRWGIAIARLRARPGDVHGLLAAMLLVSYLLISNTFILIGVSLAERLFYWPSVFVCIAMAVLALSVIRAADGIRGSWARQGVFSLLLLLLAGRAVWRSLDWRSALELYKTDFATYPQNARNAQNHGHHLIFLAADIPAGSRRNEWLAEADRALDAALAVHPNYPMALQQKGLAAELRGDRIRAAQYFEMALQFNGNDALSRTRLNALRGGAAPVRIAELTRRIQEAPEEAEPRLELARLYLARGDGSAALGQFETALRLAPESAKAAAGAAQSLLILDKREASIPYLEQAVRLDPRDWHSHTNLMAVFIGSDPAKALKHARQAFELQPGDFTVATNYAEAQAANGNTHEALRLFEQVRASLPASDPNRSSIEARIARLKKQTVP